MMLNKAPGALCETCTLRHEPMVPSRGPSNASIALVGEAPGSNEVRTGVPFIGASGQLLSKMLASVGASEPELLVTNTVLCRCVDETGKNRQPTPDEIACCRPRLIQELTSCERIITLGAVPLNALTKSKEKITKARGGAFHTSDLRGTILPTYHPAFILRSHGRFPELLHDIKQAFSKTLTAPMLPSIIRYTAVSEAHARVLLEPFCRSNVTTIVADLETTGLNFLTDKIICLVLCCKPGEVTIIPAEFVQGAAYRILRGLFNSKIIVGHNLKFDLKFIFDSWQIDLPTYSVDTMLMHYCLDERSGVHGLKQIAADRYNAPDWEAPLQAALKALKLKSEAVTNGYDLIPRSLLYEYAAYDGHFTFKLFTDLGAELAKQPRLDWLFKTILTPAANVFCRMEIDGVPLDKSNLMLIKSEWQGELAAIEAKLFALVGREFNPRSTQQLAKILYVEMGLPVQVNKDTRKPTTDAAALELLADQFPSEFLDTFMGHRTLTKLVSTYVLPLIEQANIDGFAHSTFNLGNTITGRISSEDVNLLNIPRANTPRGKKLKNSFVARDGYKIVQGDLKGAEVCVIAYYSQDKQLKKLLADGTDVHGTIAAVAFGPGYTKEQRQAAKTAFFAQAYGQTEASLARKMRHDLIEANVARNDADVLRIVRAIITAIHGMFPQVRAWQQKTVQRAFANGGLETFFGRKRRYPLISEEAKKDLHNQALNFQVQSTASDLVMLALIECEPQIVLCGGRVLLSIYDSIIAEVPDDQILEAAHVIARTMVSVPDRMLAGSGVRFAVEISVGQRWGELKEIELP